MNLPNSILFEKGLTMASLVRRNKTYYFQDRLSDKLKRWPLKTTTLQIVKEKKRQYESAQLADVAVVQLGPADLHCVLDENGAGAVGGIITARYGENALKALNSIHDPRNAQTMPPVTIQATPPKIPGTSHRAVYVIGAKHGIACAH